MAGRQRRKDTGFALACILLFLCFASACGRSDSLPSPELPGSATDQGLPFRSAGDHAAANDGSAAQDVSAAKDASVPAATADIKPITVPFHASHSRVLPTGTLLTVELEDSLSSAKVSGGSIFAAAIAAPLILDGEVVFDRGTLVTGRIESAMAETSGSHSGMGYFRLSLSAITLGSRQLALETSSLYARGTPRRAHTIVVPKGRTLTFRLTSPVAVDDSKALAVR